MKGHQDTYSSDLDIWAQRNVDMDAKAKSFLATTQRSARHYNVEGEPWQVWLKDSKITNNMQAKIYSWVQQEDIVKYWESEQDTADSVKHVDWSAIGSTIKQVPRSRQVFVSKHVAGMCGVGKFMRRWKEWDSDLCPRCGQPEDAPHVWRCRGEGTAEIWDKAVQELESLLRKLNTDSTLVHILLTYLRGWYSGESIQYEPPRAFQELVQQQSLIGWTRFFEGWLAEQWAWKQQHYYQIIKSSRTERRWVIAVIEKFWNTAWDLWEH